jgi:hypothetical protein
MDFLLLYYYCAICNSFNGEISKKTLNLALKWRKTNIYFLWEYNEKRNEMIYNEQEERKDYI